MGVTGPDGKGEDTRLSHGSELFMAADSKMITIGGGSVTFYTNCSLHPVRAKYPWVGCLTDDEKDGEGGDSRTPHARSLFMAADNTMITIGGGYVQSMVLCGPLRFRIIEY